MEYDFRQFSNVNITGVDLHSLDAEALAILYAQARYCQAMTDADIDTMRELVSEDMLFTHMSGRDNAGSSTENNSSSARFCILNGTAAAPGAGVKALENSIHANGSEV